MLIYSRCEIREKKDENDTSLIGGRWSTTKSTKFDRSKKGGNGTNVKSAERQLVASSWRSADLTFLYHHSIHFLSNNLRLLITFLILLFLNLSLRDSLAQPYFRICCVNDYFANILQFFSPNSWWKWAFGKIFMNLFPWLKNWNCFPACLMWDWFRCDTPVNN